MAIPRPIVIATSVAIILVTGASASLAPGGTDAAATRDEPTVSHRRAMVKTVISRR